MAPLVATHLLMPDLAGFVRLHPEVEVSVLSLDEPVNLANREADVAVRVVYDRKTLPPNLHGRKGPELWGGAYASCELLAAWRAGRAEHLRWVVKDNIGLPGWAQGSEVPAAPVPFRVTGADAQLAAVRQGLGMAALPCFVGDADPLLARVPGTGLRLHGTLWLLTQGETRRTERVKRFVEFVSGRLSAYAPLLAGRQVPG